MPLARKRNCMLHKNKEQYKLSVQLVAFYFVHPFVLKVLLNRATFYVKTIVSVPLKPKHGQCVRNDQQI